MIKLVLLRHGESEWNRENRFAGWTNIGLTDLGKSEAREAGAELKKAGFVFDVAFTSFLKRATDTLEIALKELGQPRLQVHSSWRLNERHYGALQGLNKTETATKYGEEQVKIWRRSYDVRPPLLTKQDPRYPGKDPLYAALSEKELPLGESLKDTVARVLPYWENEIVPQLKAGKRVLISASGNSLRALVKHLDNVSEKEIAEFNIPTGIPLVYELDSVLKPIKHYYLGDPAKVNAAIEKVLAQGKAKK